MGGSKLKLRRIQWILVVALAVVLAGASCAKKKPTPPTPVPPPPPPAPTAMLTANPNTISAGQASTLTWSTDFATSVTIDGIGKVDPGGSTKVTPTESTTYHLVAKNDTGTKEATARVTVTSAVPPTSSSTGTDSDARLFSQDVKDVFFEYDSYEISSQAEATIRSDARFLQQHPGMSFLIQGHCDERGSTDYNLALGENRAQAAKQVFVQAGIPATRMRTISYGKERPFCSESTEACWQQNRRAHFVYSK
jgi:peptidoglycan-associated lipoprotein